MDDVRAVCYIRQSKKREDDSQGSPIAQRERCAAMIASKGWDHAGVFEDIGKSGWDPRVSRPGFEEMMTAVRAGEVDAVVVFALSRLTRQGALEAMRIIDELQKHGVTLVSVEEPYLDTSTPVGVGILAIIAGLAQQESDMKSAFITATKSTLRDMGSHVSGRPPYGFTSERVEKGKVTVVRLVPHETEAAHVRWMVQQIREGMSLHAIAVKLNSRQIPTQVTGMGEKGERILAARRRAGRANSEEGKPAAWRAGNIARILRDPRLAGFAAVWEGRVFPSTDEHGNRVPGKGGKRVVQRDVDGKPMSVHEPIIPPAEWWALQDILDGRTPVVARSGKRVPSLLAGYGLFLCGVCGGPMVVDRRADTMLYRCNGPKDESHGGLAIKMDVVDDEVARRTWDRLTAMDPSDPEDIEWLAEAAERFALQHETGERAEELAVVRSELEHVRGALETLYDDREAGDYDGPTGTARFREANKRLQAHEQRLMERVTELDTSITTGVTIPSDWVDVEGDVVGPGSPWSRMDLTERRAFLNFFIDRVTADKSVGRGRNANTRDRVKIQWASPPEQAEGDDPESVKKA